MIPTLPIPIKIQPVENLGRILPTLETAMRGAARLWGPSWIAISRRRDAVTLNDVLPRPTNTNVILFSSGTSERLTGRRDRLEETFPVDDDIDVLERHHFSLRSQRGQASTAGFLLRPTSFITLYQSPDATEANAELMLASGLGGHDSLLEIEAIQRDFPALFTFDGGAP